MKKCDDTECIENENGYCQDPDGCITEFFIPKSEHRADAPKGCPVQAGCSRGAKRNEATRAGLMGKTAHSRSAQRNENVTGQGTRHLVEGTLNPIVRIHISS